MYSRFATAAYGGCSCEWWKHETGCRTGGKRMLAIERKNEILAILQKEQRVLVSELSKRYEVTDETIRRDLEKLEKEGFVKRTYGGAVLNKRKDLDMPLRIREKTNRGEKQIIAGLVKDLIEEGDRIKN